MLGTTTSAALPAFPRTRCRLRLGGKGRWFTSHGNFHPQTPICFPALVLSQLPVQPGARRAPSMAGQRRRGATGALGRAGAPLRLPPQGTQVEPPPPGDAGSEHPVPPAADRTAFTERRRVSTPAQLYAGTGCARPIAAAPAALLYAGKSRPSAHAAVSRSRQRRSLYCSGREKSPAAALHVIPSPLIRAREQQLPHVKSHMGPSSGWEVPEPLLVQRRPLGRAPKAFGVRRAVC